MSLRVPVASVVVLAAALLTADRTPAQVARPPAPDRYQAQLRYRIRAGQEQRIRQFEALAKHLTRVGFAHADERAFLDDLLDPAAETAVGTIPAANVDKLFADPNVQTVLLTPVGSTPFADPKRVTQVRIDLNRNLAAREQQLLHQQAAERLAKLGFAPADGYDNLGYTRLRGTMPAGRVPDLLKDLRALPAGWFIGEADRDVQPLPLRAVTPVRVVTVLPDLPPPPAVFDGRGLGKLTADLKAAVAEPATADAPLVVEAVLEYDTTGVAGEVRGRLRSRIPGIMVEGFAGSVATIRLQKGLLLARLAEEPDVRHLRLPRAASETTSATTGQAYDFLATSRLKDLHALGYTGAGTAVVVVAAEFPGLSEKLENAADGKEIRRLTIGPKTLPPGSRLFDLTGEVSPSLEPRPVDPLRGIGGTAAALAVNTAAPDAALVLVRIAPTRMHQVLTVAKAVTGEESISPALVTRSEELSVRGAVLESRRRADTLELQRAFSDLSDDEKATERRNAAAAAVKQLRADEAAYKQQLDRFLGLKSGLVSLRGAAVVVNTLVWDVGHPHDGQSELSRLIERSFAAGTATSAIRANRRPLTSTWVQAGSRAVGAVWSGPYRDADGNGVMEYSPATQPIPAGRWTRELNFLGYREAGQGTTTLPAGAKVRVTLQWREPHNPDVVLPGEPTVPFTLRLFRQIDPAAETVSSDELVEVARSVGESVRLLKTEGSGVYEATLDATITDPGVYALRVDRGLDASGLPPASQVSAELRPRLTVELADPAQAAKGRVVFDTYSSQAAGVGIPGDSPAAIAVGTADPSAPSKPTSLTGVGPGVVLGVKPDVLTHGVIEVNGSAVGGTGVAAGYAGGLAACLISANVRPNELVKAFGLKPGTPLVLPAEWVRSLRPATAGVRESR